MIEKMTFLTAVENRASFFRRIELLFPSLDHRYLLIEQAYNDAKDAFRGKYRDDQTTRYFEHIRAVVLILIVWLRVRDFEIIIAAILHDIVEDCPEWTVERVRVRYGNRVALLVQYLTKPSKEEYPDKAVREFIYNSRFEFAPRDFFLIKLPDRLHNVITLWNCDEAKRARKIEETRLHYLPYAERELILLHELEEALELLERAA